ncbi:MAG: hypothetical protein WBB01_12235 [Phormidesmis sp.]
MSPLSKTELQSLLGIQQSICVSIYLPTHTAGRETRQDPIRLKNQLSQAEAQLSEAGISESEQQQLLKPANALLENEDFWQHQSSGLALFITAGQLRTYRVPLEFEAMTVVSNQFYAKPLIPLVTDDGQFYVLAASQNKVTLYQATRSSIQPVDLGNTPLSLETALRYDDPEESLQGHTGSRMSGSGGGQTVFHGQGGGKDTDNSDILRFFHLVADGVEGVIGGQTVPLVFMGVDFLFPLYKEANQYPHLMPEAVSFQPDQLDPEEVHNRVLTVVEPYFSANRRAAIEQYGNLLDKKQATADLQIILNASHDGQIDTLFLAANAQVWGSFDAKSRQISQHDERTADSQDLLNLAAVQALSTDAQVFVVDRTEVPDQAAAAATLRYPILNADLVGT